MSAKRLAIYLGCALVIYCVGMWAATIKRTRERNQLRNNERQVEAHLALIRPQWEAFKQTNAGLEFVQIKVTYHAEGSLGIRGPVTSQVQVAQVLQFIRDTHPPRPVWTNTLTVDPEWYQTSLAELHGAANRSQPFSSATSRAPSAAGSHR